jgi:hypothetical protein
VSQSPDPGGQILGSSDHLPAGSQFVSSLAEVSVMSETDGQEK